MPTGEDQRNPQGLMKAAGDARHHTAQVHAQVDRLLAQLGESSELAAALDEAVMREDREGVVELLKKGGIEGEITIGAIDADRRMEFTVCAILGVFACVVVSVSW
jgi:hypothetical protein